MCKKEKKTDSTYISTTLTRLFFMNHMTIFLISLLLCTFNHERKTMHHGIDCLIRFKTNIILLRIFFS